MKTTFSAESIYGGALLGARGAGFICFYDWETGAMVRRIDVLPRSVFWSENGNLVCLACAENFYVLRYSAGALEAQLASGTPMPEDGLENAFEVVSEVQER